MGGPHVYSGCGCPASGHDPRCGSTSRRHQRNKSRIKVYVGQSGGPGHEMRCTLVELPFTEANPTMAFGMGTAYDRCKVALDRISVAERDVVLANLLTKYGEQV